MTRRVTAAMVLPSTVEVGSFSVCMVDSGNFLERTVKWPTPLVGLEVMHKKWLTDASCQYQPYHPDFNGFVESMKPLRAKSTDWIASSARIALHCEIV